MMKAVALLSGGLDSTLAARLMLDQRVEVFALNLITPFCTCTRQGCRHQASKVADQLGVPVRVLAGGAEYLDMLRSPKHGYGRNMNPCIDCRIFTFKAARNYMRELGASFVFTGEVLGQRPMSQRRDAMRVIERESGLEGLVVRPLSAHLLPATLPERERWIDREKLLAIQGRSRASQNALADEYGMTDYLCPAGGCRLTDPSFAQRLREAFEHGEWMPRDISLLRHGRHFRLPSGVKAIVGRNELENERLSRLTENTDLILEVKRHPSPVALLRRPSSDDDIASAARICARYADCQPGVAVVVEVRAPGRQSRDVEVIAPTPAEVGQHIMPTGDLHGRAQYHSSGGLPG